MKHLLPIPVLFFILLLAGNCKKYESSFENNNVGFSISGRVLDKDNVPVGQAEVKAGTATTRTDDNGYFSLTNVRLPATSAFVRVEKNGYFLGSRTFIAHEGATNYVKIRLIKKENDGSFVAASGGTVSLASGCSLTFASNSVVDAATNNAYAGTVMVSAFFIDPSQDDFITIMPGDLRGITTANEERGLKSFGMMAVELTGSGGQKLQIASGKQANLSFAIPLSLASSAPATIPLWYFDETTGLWKEEGSATKQGNKYVGNVNHFSFWNCDAPFPTVGFEAVVHDQNGHAVVNALVTIRKLSDNTIASAITDDAGRVSGKIPANQSLELKIFNPCGDQLYQQNIGPFSGNTNLGTINVNVPAPASLTITGTAVTCNNTPVANGFANISLGGLTYRATISNGNFSITISRCSGTPAQAQIFVEDVGNHQQGSIQSIAVSSGNVNAGQLTACGTATDEFINYVLDGVNYSIASPADSLLFIHSDSANVPYNLLEGMSNSSNAYLEMDYKGPAATGNFAMNVTVIDNNNVKYEGAGLNGTIGQIGSTGQFVIGNFSGTVLLNGTTPKSISCSFKVRRVL